MPQDSAIYGVARIRCHEKDLIGREKLSRMAEGTLEEAMRALHDMGYGSMPDAGPEQAEDMISAELKAAYALVREVTFDQPLTDLFLMKADVNNLKLLLKLRLTGSQEEPALMEGGCYSPETLTRMVQEGSYKELPEEFKAALAALEQGFQSGVDPARISIELDKAYLAHALNRGGEAAPYFRAQADFGNILTMLRIRANGAGAAKLREALLPEGDVPHSRLIQALDAPADGLGKLIATGPARERILKGLEQYLKNGSIAALERERDNYIISLASEGKYRDESMGPVLGYLLAREQEAKCVRLIITAKRNGLAEEVITERLRELYG